MAQNRVTQFSFTQLGGQLRLYPSVVLIDDKEDVSDEILPQASREGAIDIEPKKTYWIHKLFVRAKETVSIQFELEGWGQIPWEVVLSEKKSGLVSPILSWEIKKTKLAGRVAFKPSLSGSLTACIRLKKSNASGVCEVSAIGVLNSTIARNPGFAYRAGSKLITSKPDKIMLHISPPRMPAVWEEKFIDFLDQKVPGFPNRLQNEPKEIPVWVDTPTNTQPVVYIHSKGGKEGRFAKYLRSNRSGESRLVKRLIAQTAMEIALNRAIGLFDPDYPHDPVTFDDLFDGCQWAADFIYTIAAKNLELALIILEGDQELGVALIGQYLKHNQLTTKAMINEETFSR